MSWRPPNPAELVQLEWSRPHVGVGWVPCPTERAKLGRSFTPAQVAELLAGQEVHQPDPRGGSTIYRVLSDAAQGALF